MADQDRPTVLVVEDEADLADMFAEWLEQDYEVRVVYDGEAALEALDDEVDVALLDRLMDGLSGDDVLDEMAERGHTPKVAMITAVEPDLDILDLGFDDYLVKPVFADELLDTVERLLDWASYDGRLQRYFSLASKRAALEEYRSESELESSEEYAEMRAEIAEIRADLRELVEGFDDESFEAAFHSLDRSPARDG
jgi:DNA-binding response OmpR family regulator